MAFQDLNWARWSGDGNLYFVTLLGVSGNTVSVRYYDGTEEDVDKKNTFNLVEALNAGLFPHGNWQGQGGFYLCEILKLGENSVLVKYEDGVEENMPYEWLVFLRR
ncbi:MAG: hypothetical protein LBH44_09405 [Treponema sp.]|jgi:hypothetical protein|nr:hypothetical protein [Treponema sp.]